MLEFMRSSVQISSYELSKFAAALTQAVGLTRARGAPPRVEPLPSYGVSARGRSRSRLARGPRVNLLCHPHARARAFPQFSVPALMARQWSARCYGVARQREGSRPNSIGSAIGSSISYTRARGRCWPGRGLPVATGQLANERGRAKTASGASGVLSLRHFGLVLYPLILGAWVPKNLPRRGWFRPGRCCSTGSGRLDLDLDLLISGPRDWLFYQLYTRARALLARPWSARCYGVARPREGSRPNSIGGRDWLFYQLYTRARALLARPWS